MKADLLYNIWCYFLELIRETTGYFEINSIKSRAKKYNVQPLQRHSFQIRKSECCVTVCIVENGVGKQNPNPKWGFLLFDSLIYL